MLDTPNVVATRTESAIPIKARLWIPVMATNTRFERGPRRDRLAYQDVAKPTPRALTTENGATEKARIPNPFRVV